MPDVRAQEPCPTVPVAWNIPKMNTKNSGTLCENAEKNAVASPLKVIFSLEMGLPEKTITIFLFGFCFLIPYASRFFFHNKNTFRLHILLIFTKNCVISIN